MVPVSLEPRLRALQPGRAAEAVPRALLAAFLAVVLGWLGGFVAGHGATLADEGVGQASIGPAAQRSEFDRQPLNKPPTKVEGGLAGEVETKDDDQDSPLVAGLLAPSWELDGASRSAHRWGAEPSVSRELAWIACKGARGPPVV